jgi:CDP-diacylglycerol---glycerol-3-phosphate 3-phosphatidyltransferase
MKIPTVYDLKPAFQRTLTPLCDTLAKRGITANQVTATTAILAGVYGAALYASSAPVRTVCLAGLPAFLLVRMALNAIDGMIATRYRQRTLLGAYLNELGDVISDAALYLPFAAIPTLSSAAIVLIVVLAATAELAGVLATLSGKPRCYAGPFGKSDRAVFFGLLGILAALQVSAVVTNLLLVVALALSVVTIVNRVRIGTQEAA